MARIPWETIPDSTLAFMRDPYRFISKRCREHNTDLFETRLFFRPAICMTGRASAEVFYDSGRFLRNGATPKRFQKTLFGTGGVQGLDGQAHWHRKEMFLSLMSDERIRRLKELTAQAWDARLQTLNPAKPVVLYDLMREILTRVVCAWSGVPLHEEEVGWRTHQLTALFDAAGSFGPRYWWSRFARQSADDWLEEVVNDVRAGRFVPPTESALNVIGWHCDPAGELLTPRASAVELANVLRPTVAVAVYVTLAAHALVRYPSSRQQILCGAESEAEWFVQEVRRFYPFFPSVIASVRRDFDWQGYHFPRGRRVILDLYGTNHDPRVWDAPDEFRPERFASWNGDPFSFIPQGGGDHAANHRCPGEWITIELMKVAVEFLVNRMRYAVPEQDLRIDYSRLPALPRSQMVLCDVRAVT